MYVPNFTYIHMTPGGFVVLCLQLHADTHEPAGAECLAQKQGELSPASSRVEHFCGESGA